ncbi:MAG: aspartate--tRNA ligase [Thermodesulfobacteriota bacterium]
MVDFLGDLRRTDYCGSLRPSDEGREVVLMGWVQRRRDHGGVIFVDLRDREGIIQVVFNPEINPEIHAKAHRIRSEFVLAVKGEVTMRPAESINPDLDTGEIEVLTKELRILSASENPPFLIEDNGEISENVRLRYRYLDLRRPRLQRNLILRHKVAKAVRTYLDGQGFLEIETPVLTRSTPEGARDYLVPSRVNPGRFYALPQSPQLFKQLLMVSGLDRYYQIVRCFRDEDLRMDRQPEFTQIDIEMSFVGVEDIQRTMEGMMAFIFREVLDLDLPMPFPVLGYEEALDRYGTDKPDIRFGLELKEISDLVGESGFGIFREVIEEGGIVKGTAVEGGASLSRSEVDNLVGFVQGLGAQGLIWVKVVPEGWQSPIAKFFEGSSRNAITERMAAGEGDLLLFVAGDRGIVNHTLANLRLHLGGKLDLIPSETYRFVWVRDFPLLEFSQEERRYVAVHHPFTAPKDEDIPLLEDHPEEVKAKSYDLVLNGIEIGGGSIRNHIMEVQSMVFRKLGIGEEEAKERFGFLMEALRYGPPPHGGIAFGFDRIVMILSGSESIREVIAFPKTQKATCPLTEAPTEVDPKQLDELSIKVKPVA